MPRKLRTYLPGVPCHVVQRGNDRKACFFQRDDYPFFLQCLGEACRRYGVSLHAYVLMTNHVHLLMTPSSAEGISRVMQLVGNRYVQYVNRSYRRTGTLWEGRHKASLIDAERYLLSCYRYIELNPVRAGMVAQPGEYAWSSYPFHALGKSNPLIADHEVYLRLGNDVVDRRSAYAALFRTELNSRDAHAIRRSATFSIPLGRKRFISRIERLLNRSHVPVEDERPAPARGDATQSS
jgi:putative transposase